MYNIITLENNKVLAVKSVAKNYVLGEDDVVIPEYRSDIIGKLYDPETQEFSVDTSIDSEEARQWRDSELERTDTLALLPDYPQAEALLVYRQALRDWTDTEDFPETRPELGA